MMHVHHDAQMRTTIDIPEREHALFTSLARAQRTTLGKLLIELAERGLRAGGVADTPAGYELDSETGLPVFSSGRPVTKEDIDALEDEELDRHGSSA